MFLQTDHSFDRTQKDDDELWLAYLEGQKTALGRIFLRYYTRLYRYGVKLVGREGAVQDAIQELFLKLWKKRKKINKADCVEFYLLHSLRRILLRQAKQDSSYHRRNKQYMEDVSYSLHSTEERIIFKEQQDERYQLFLKAQETLTARQKEILYLRMQHGMTNGEIAQFLNLSMQRVKNCMYESIKLLKESVYQSSVNKHI